MVDPGATTAAGAGELCFMPALELRDAIRARSISPVEAVAAVLEQVERVNPRLNAFVTLLGEQALQQAEAAERRLGAGAPEDLGALHGVPVTVKDLTPTAGIRTTFGSPAYSDHIPEEDALAWSRLKAAGAILIGKTTTPEFGMKGVTESALTGVTNNPWNLACTAGGSSGGAAASVAAGMGHLAWGSDGGGSIRIPAACCGVVGLKASIGRISTLGEGGSIFETASAVGPITRNVTDSALMLSVTTGEDYRDPHALPAPERGFEESLEDATIRGLRVAYCPELGGARIAAEVRACVDRAAEVFERDLGAHVELVDVDLPDPIQYFLDRWSPGFAQALDQGLLGPDPPELVMHLAELGRGRSAEQYATTLFETRAEIAAGFADTFATHDLLLTPTMTVAPFPHPGEVGGNTEVDGVPVQVPAIDFHRLTEPPSHAGIPALTVPCGFTPNGLPVGLQIAAAYRADALVLRAGRAYELATPWHTRRPPVGGG